MANQKMLLKEKIEDVANAVKREAKWQRSHQQNNNN